MKTIKRVLLLDNYNDFKKGEKAFLIEDIAKKLVEEKKAKFTN